jgi:outer membrane protein assembly factor BamB
MDIDKANMKENYRVGVVGTAHPTLFLVAWCVLAACCTPAWADWPTARGNAQRTGNIDGFPGPKAPKVLWVYKAQEHYVASPAAGAKAIYLGGVGTYGTGMFHAVATGSQVPERVLWSKAAPFITRPTVCSPAVMEGLVVFGDGMHQTDDAVLYCVRADDGLPVWQLPVPGKLVHLEAAPTIDNGRVYVCGGDAGVLCVDLKRVTLDGREQDIAAVIPFMAKRWGELLAKYEQEKKKDPLLAIPPSEDALPKPVGKLRWQQGQGKWHIDAPPVVAGDQLLAASAYLDDEKVGKRSLLCLKAADGSVVWEAPLGINPWAGPTLAGNLVLVGCSNIRFDKKLLDKAQGEVVAIDLSNGQVRWRHGVRGGVLSPIAVKGNLAVYTSTEGKIVALNCADGRQVWAYDAKRPFFAGPAIAGQTVYAADLNAAVHAVGLGDGKAQWTLDVAADPAVQARGMVFGSPVVHGGDLYLATCNLEGEADQPTVIVCLSDKSAGARAAAQPVTVDKEKRSVIVPCRIAPRKLPTLKEVYPLEVVATYPSPRGQKAHETVVVFECKPSEVHKALESLGLKPGKPARGEGTVASGPEVKVFLEFPGLSGRPRVIPIEKAMVDVRTGKTMPPLKWHFTGSVTRQPDPNKEERVYGADFGGTLISLVPVTDETVCQSNLTMKEERLLKLDTNRDVLPEEGTEVKLIIQAK